MTRFALKGLFGRKLRTALTAIAVVLGVAMISGTYVLTDSITSAFDAIFSETYRGTDAAITGKSAFDLGDSGGSQLPSFDESLLPKVKELPEVQAALGGVQGDAHLIGKNGKAIVFGGAPNIGFSVDPSQPQFNSLELVEGEWPGQGGVVIDKATADKKHFEIGDTVGIQSEGPVGIFHISGIVKFTGDLATIGGATLAGFDLPTAQLLFGKQGKLDAIRIASKPDVPEAKLLASVRAILPLGTQVRSGTAQASEDASDVNSFISFLQTFLLAFAGVALFVGAFVIANSLSITIAQRMREFATLRTLGASRKQVLGSVIVESLVMGILASVTGLFLGLFLAKGLFKLFDLIGFTLPNSGLTFQTRTIVVSLLVGILITLLASLRPALRATRVPPIAAVREGATLPPGRFARFRTVGSLAGTALGFAALLVGLFVASGTGPVLAAMGVGTLLIFLGVAGFAAQLVRPLAGLLGWPATRIGGAAGALARDNARRNPQRTASTAAALMIGLALVTFVAVLAQGIISTFTSAVNEEFTAAYAITSQNNFDPIPTSAAEAAAKARGVEALASVRTGDARIFNSTTQATAVDDQIGQVITLKWKDGSQAVLGELGADGAITDDGYAKTHHLRVGSQVSVLTPAGKRLRLTIKGIFKPPSGGSPFGPVTFSSSTFDANYAHPRNLFTFIEMRGGVTDANTKALEDSLRGFPNAKSQTKHQFVDNQIGPLKKILYVLYVLLALSVLVSLFGIVNMLVLTVFERTRELGMLRAIGMTRVQVRKMIRHESVITALIGGTLGIVLGIVLGGLLIARVDEIEFAVPVLQLVIFAVATVFVGILAAIVPARRAAKLDPLEALQYE